MLNSKIIDVDKLDYLIRDAYITGFDTANIDFERLLSSLTISMNDGKYEIAYYKNAISVIENVVYAHDSERKWIQTHPVVLYEAYILQHVIAYLSDKIDKYGKKLFSLETLGTRGKKFDNGLFISLLCDDDIIFLMKNVFPIELSKEFFERRERRHPVWKSEAEYKAFILELATGGRLLDNFVEAMSVTAKYLVKSTDSWVIDDALISNFIILMASQFNSGFGKADFTATKIAFQTRDEEKLAKVGDIVSSLNAKGGNRDNFFYLFYKRKAGADMGNADIDNQEICKKLFKDVAF